jgi:hypothetical protein
MISMIRRESLKVAILITVRGAIVEIAEITLSIPKKLLRKQ